MVNNPILNVDFDKKLNLIQYSQKMDEANDLNDKGMYKQALLFYTEAEELNNSDYKLYYNRGLAFYGLDEFEKAIEDFDIAISLQQDDYKSHCEKANALYATGNYDEALTCYNNAIKINPKYILSYENKISLLISYQRYEAALECCDKLLKVSPESDIAYYNRAKIYFVLNKKKVAKLNLMKAININSQNRKVALQDEQLKELL